MKKFNLLFFLLVSILQLQICSAQTDLESVPTTWSATKGTLSADTNHYRLGSKSIAWKWTANDTLKVTGIKFNPFAINSSSTNTFDIGVYNTVLSPSDSLTIQFFDKKKRLRYYFSLRLNYKGWYEVIRVYKSNMYKPSNAPTTVDSITTAYFIAPYQGSGQLNFDAVSWIGSSMATPISLPMPDSIIKTTGRYPIYDDNTIYNLPPNVNLTTPSTSEKSDFNKVLSSFMTDIYAANKVTAADIASANVYYDSTGFSVNIDGTVKGQAVFGYPFNPEGPYRDFTSNFQTFAYAWYQFNDTVSLNKAIVMLRFLLDNGNFAGGNYRIGTYNSPNFYTGLALLANKIYSIDTTLFNDLSNYVKWDLRFGCAWMPPTVYSPLSTDNPRKQIIGFMGYPLAMIRDTAIAIQYLRGFNKIIANFMIPNDGQEDNIKVDGSSFHHLAHYYSYTQPLYVSYAQWLFHLRNTQFKTDSLTYARIRDMTYNFFLQENVLNTSYGNKGEGQSDFFSLSGTYNFLSRLARLGNGITGTGADTLLAGAYNRIFSSYKDNNLPTTKFPAEEYPSGFIQMNYANMGLYRKNKWLATVKMLSPDFWGVECGLSGSSGQRRDVYSRYLPYGSIDILYNGVAANKLSGSFGTSPNGYTFDIFKYTNGYDHRFPNGATTIVLNLDSLACNEPYGKEFAYSGSLAASLSFQNRVKNFSFKTRADYGLSAMKFQQAPYLFQSGCRGPQRDTSFKFQKSWFAFDTIIVCLGSGITNKNAINKTQTNIFQLTDSNQTMFINGIANKAFNYTSHLFQIGPYQIISPYGTGFYIKSNDSLHISVKKQQFSLKVDDSIYQSAGNWANVWLDHGTAPYNKGYEYVIIPNTKPSALNQFATSMSSTATAIYIVKQADSAMHYVYYKPKNIQGYAIFQPINKIGDSTSILKSVDKPCYAMGINQGDTLLSLTIVNPSPNLQKSNTISSFFPPQLIQYSIATPLVVTIRGKWKIVSSDSEIVIVAKSDSTTTLRVNTQYALPYDATLKKDSGTLLYIKELIIPYLPNVVINQESLRVYPNPVTANKVISIHYQSMQERRDVQVEIYTEDGKKCYSNKIKVNKGDNIINVPNLKTSKGICVAKVYSETLMPLVCRFIVR